MAGGMDIGQGGKGGKKPLDTAINLVPFIDLMAVTISFLIMTAVWTQIGRLPVMNQGNSIEESEPTEKPPMPVFLAISDRELRLTAGGSQFDPIPITRDGKTNKMDVTKLQARLKELKSQLPPEHSTITVQADDIVKYEDLVQVIDECIGAGLPNVSVSPSSATG